MHLKTPKHLQQKSKLLKIRAYFYKRSNFSIKCICQKVFFRPVKWLKSLLVKKKTKKNFSKIEILFQLEQTIVQVKIKFFLKNF